MDSDWIYYFILKKYWFSNIILETTISQNAILIILFWMIKRLLLKSAVFFDLAIPVLYNDMNWRKRKQETKFYFFLFSCVSLFDDGIILRLWVWLTSHEQNTEIYDLGHQNQCFLNVNIIFHNSFQKCMRIHLKQFGVCSQCH